MDRRRILMAVSGNDKNDVFTITIHEGDSNENTVLLYNLLAAKAIKTDYEGWVVPLDDFKIVFVGTQTSDFDGVIISAVYFPLEEYFRMQTQNSSNVANIYLDMSGFVNLSIYG